MRTICANAGRMLAALGIYLAAPGHAATVYTGDVINGVRVVSALDVSDLEAGKGYRFLFQGVEMATGQRYYVPVMVAKGANPGKKVLICAGVHGDELSPTDAVQRSFAELDPAKMSGTVLAVLDIGRPAMEQIQRKWPTPVWGGLHLRGPAQARDSVARGADPRGADQR